ncbi:MAG: AI-2E family transporter [Eubacteriales bacterium]
MQDTKKTFLYITYIAFLALIVLQFDNAIGLVQNGIAVFTPFFLGFVIAFMLAQPCNFFYKKISEGNIFQKHARSLSVALSYLVVFVVIYLIFSVVIPKLNDSVTIFRNSLEGYLANLQVWLNTIKERFDIEALNEINFNDLNEMLKNLLQNTLISISGAADKLLAMTGSFLTAVINFVMALVFSIYMLAGKDDLCNKARRVAQAYLPKKASKRLIEVVALSSRIFSSFIAGQLVEACILGSLCALGMLLIMPDYALLIGIIVGVSALVPVVGGYVGGGFAFLLIFIVSPMKSVVFVVFLLILQQFEGNVIYPRVVGNSVGLPGLWVLFAVIVGSDLLGITGALVSVPTVSVLYALLREDVLLRERRNEISS